MKNLNLLNLKSIVRSKARWLLTLFAILTLGVGQMWGAWTGNAGINVNDTWYKASSNIDGGHWLNSESTINGTDLGVISSLELGGEYQNWDEGKDDACGWNSNNGIWITITTNSGTQIDNFKLSCYRAEKSGNNNVWKTTGTTGTCGDGSSWAAYSVDISDYEAGIYKLKVHWFSASGVALPSSGDDVATFTIAPVVTFKANGGTGSDYTQTVTYNTNTTLNSNTFSKTGYNFAGWATTSDGNVTYSNGGTVNLTAHTNLFAKWTAKTTTVNLNKNTPAGQTVSGAASVTATYDAALPSFTALTCTGGYSLTGYWTAATGAATKVINADGTYADNSGIWNRTDGATLNLYARWSADPGVSLAAAKTSGINVGETVRLTATGSNASNITKYDFYEGSTKIGTVTTSATSATYDYTPTTTGSKTMKVIMTYNSGSNTVTSSNVALTLNTPSVGTLTEANDSTQMWIGVNPTGALTFSATSSNVGSGASVTWSISDASSGTFTQTGAGSYSGKSWTYVPASTGSKTITVTMTVGGNNYTKTYSLEVYERWNIYVQNNCSWGAVALYLYGNGTNATWPGVTGASTACEPYTAKWYKVTLDSYYPYFILDNNVSGTGQEQLPGGNAVATNKGTYGNDTYWDFNYTGTTDGVKYYNLRSISPSAPTVSITSTEVISSTQIKLTGTISNYGSDGSSAASDLKEVGFYCGETKHSTTHTSSSTFTKVISGLSAGTTYTFKAYAVNVKGEGKQASGTNVTTRAGGTYTIKVRTAVDATAPKIYAWTDADANDGVKEENATYGSGAAMTAAITGTVYKWWSYELNKTYNNFLIYQTGDGNKTNNITAPQSATCYWYNSSNAIASRYGTMDCPHLTPQLYIETTAGGGSYDYYEMTNTSGTLSKSLTLTAKSTYKFKIFYNGEYFGKEEDKTATRASNTIEDLIASTDTYAEVKTDAAGSYTFEFTTGGKDLTVTYPTAYTITYGIGAINGSSTAISASSSPSFTSGDYVLKTTAVTFSKGTTKNGYHWEGWYSNNDGTGTCHSSTDGNWTSAANTRTDNIKVYACYSLNTYTITYNLDGGSNHGDNPANFNVETSTITLQDPSKTGYTFDGWYTDEDFDSEGNTITKGTYANQEFWAKWTANEYTITLNCNGATSTTDVPSSVTARYDATAPDEDGAGNYRFDDIAANPEKTGYTFAGWWTSGFTTEIITKYTYYNWGTSYVDASGHWKYDGDLTVYAKWTPNNYDVTLSQSGETGYGSAGAKSSVSATYGADMPAMGTAPVGAAGYKFQGYYSGVNGTGTKYYNADGTSARTWDIAEGTTLHAYFQKAEITNLTMSSTTLAKAPSMTLDVNPTFNIVPEGYIAICWTVHYAENDNEVDGSKWSVAAHTEEGEKPNQVRFTLTNVENGSYYVKATLKANGASFDACSTGTLLGTFNGNFSVIGSSTVTIRYVDGSGNALRANGSVEIEAAGNADITAPDILGYTFSRWELGDVTQNSGEGAEINISSTFDATIKAIYNKKQMIYFNNTLGWDTVYVYFYNNGNYWGDTQGTGANTGYYDGSYTGKYSGMTKIGDSNIYYYDVTANSATGYTNVAFTEKDQNGADYFYNENNVIKRGDYSAALSLYVPLSGIEPEEMNGPTYTAYYYGKGYWMNYPDNTGYTLKIYDNRTDGALKKELKFPFSADSKMPISITTDLEGGKTYGFTIYRADGNIYGNNGEMSNGHSGDEGQGVWEFKTDKSKAGLTTSSAGNYTFTLNYGLDIQETPEYNYLVGVRYPEATGDFRVQYSDNVNSTWKTSVVIPAGTEKDTVSYFVRQASSPKIKAQKCTATYDKTTTVTWADENEGADLLPDTIKADGVYNFIFTKEDGELVLSAVEPYTGNFYIRVDGAGSTNWDSYRASDHLMPYSDYSFSQTTNPYSHYFTKWYDCDASVKNIKFVVANDYSTNVSDTLVQGDIENISDYIDEFGNLSRSANVRFMYNKSTNAVSRSFIDGAYANGGNFLKILARTQDSIYAAAEGGDPLTEITFTDNGNWLYEQTVFAQPGARYKLRSLFGTTEGGKHVITQYFKGGAGSTAADSATMIGGDGSSRLQIRLIYDFKTNRLVTAYVPASEISDPLAINADVMFVREGQGDVQTITFTGDGKLTDITAVYSTLRFDYATLNDPSISRYERDLFWVSFPYDVKVSDIIGFGTYGQHWIIEYYDGNERAANGFWADTRGFWKFVTPAMKNTFVLKAGVGYLVALDLDELWWTGEGSGEHASIWDNTDQVELLFPGNVSSISNAEVTVSIPSHACTINRGTSSGDRRIKDSHWNVLGIPTYLNTTNVTYKDNPGTEWMTDGKPKYIYSWNKADNTLSPTSAAGFVYHSMQAYMVQYFGDITFATSVSPAGAPRRNPDLRADVEFRVEIQQNEETADHTYIRFSNDEDVSTGFNFGEDMSKEFNQNRANIYTLIGYEPVAGNVLPTSDQTTVIPVGVKIAADGEYTFSIPEGTEGIGVTLIDTETSIRTNLSALDYNVVLEAGEYNNRFIIEISPVSQVATDIESLNGEHGESGARKMMIDGILYIVKDGKIFDARGSRVE